MTPEPDAYFDPSAIFKLLVVEPHSDDLRDFLSRRDSNRQRWSSELSFTEVSRRLMSRGLAHSRGWGDVLNAVLSKFGLISLDHPTLALAARLPGQHLRSVDAIHIATALRLQKSLPLFVTYDGRQAEAARGLGLDVVSPGLN